MPEVASPFENVRIYLFTLAISDLAQIPEWGLLPDCLIHWIQAQDGLKIDGRPISNNEDLARAYQLLRCEEKHFSGSSIIQIAFIVSITYAIRISRARRACVNDLLILGAPPRNIMPRRCSKCKQRALDDGFAYYAKLDSRKYVVWTLEAGCGLPGCSGRAALIPSDDRTPYITSARRDLENPPNTHHPANWARYFLRSDEECGGLSKDIKIRCVKCQNDETDTRPRWTAEDIPRYAEARRLCRTCNKLSSWRPANGNTPSVCIAALSRLWSRFEKAGCNLEKFPRVPHAYFSAPHIPKRIALLESERKKRWE